MDGPKNGRFEKILRGDGRSSTVTIKVRLADTKKHLLKMPESLSRAPTEYLPSVEPSQVPKFIKLCTRGQSSIAPESTIQ